MSMTRSLAPAACLLAGLASLAIASPDEEQAAGVLASEAGPQEKALACLRLAALLYRSRRDFPLPAVRLSYQDRAYRLDVPHRWLSENQLSAAALGEESLAWMQAGMDLQVVRRAG